MTKTEILTKCKEKQKYSSFAWLEMVAGQYCMEPKTVVDMLLEELGDCVKINGYCCIDGESGCEYYFTTTNNRVFKCNGDCVEEVE